MTISALTRAVRTIARLAEQYDSKDVAEALLKHGSQRDRGDVGFVGQFLIDVWELNRKADEEAEPRCCECGGASVTRRTTFAPMRGTARRNADSAPTASALWLTVSAAFGSVTRRQFVTHRAAHSRA
jgi:hypothetical protein